MAGSARSLDGLMRIVGAAGAEPSAAPVRATLDDERFSFATSGASPLIGAYRDITAMVAQPGALLLVLGDGDRATRVSLEGFGERQAGLQRDLRERRTLQRLRDQMVQLDPDPLETVEYRIGAEHAVAELAFQPWAAELVPVDERRDPVHLRRGEIATVVEAVGTGTLRVERSTGAPPIELLGLGSAATRLGQRFSRLRDGATADAAALVGVLVPDAPFGARQRLASLLIDGRPASVGDLGDTADLLAAAALSEPTFADSYRSLVERATAADPAAQRWFALAPATPGGTDAKTWFFVALPGNLLAFELVSAGAHATYAFRVMPRADYAGQPASSLGPALSDAVSEISNALIDARFLREPMALPETQLASARYGHYRLALASLPSLAAARRRFVARLVHDDPTRWTAALDELIAWHASARDDAAEWPGRGAQEDVIVAASGEAPDPTSGS